MNLLKRIYLSISRRLSKSIFLLLIVFLLGNLMICSFYVLKFSEITKENIKSSLGGLVTIHASENQTNKFTQMILEDDADGIMAMSGNIMDSLSELSVLDDVSQIDVTLQYEQLYTDLIDSHSYNLKYGFLRNLPIRGVNTANFEDLVNERIVVNQGRTFTKEELAQGSRVILLPENVRSACSIISEVKDEMGKVIGFNCIGEQNEVKLGDKISLFRIVENDEGIILKNEIVEYEIIGFYKTLEVYEKNTFFYNEEVGSYIPANAVIYEYERTNELRNEVAGQLEKEELNQNHYHIHSISLKIDDPNQLDQFTQLCKHVFEEKNLTDLEYRSSAETYEIIAGPVNSVSVIAMISLILTGVISITILGLVTTLFLKERKKEIGIYMALGERKWKLITQIVLEVYLIGLLGITLSFHMGNMLGKTMGSMIMNDMIQKQEEVTKKKLEEMGSVVPQEYEFSFSMEDVHLSVEYIGMIYGVGSITIWLSTLAPIGYTLRMDPKKILM